jgi:hypothetical protein
MKKQTTCSTDKPTVVAALTTAVKSRKYTLHYNYNEHLLYTSTTLQGIQDGFLTDKVSSTSSESNNQKQRRFKARRRNSFVIRDIGKLSSLTLYEVGDSEESTTTSSSSSGRIQKKAAIAAEKKILNLVSSCIDSALKKREKAS